MGTTTSGWLRPDDVSKRAAARRALHLLGDYLDDDQRMEAENFGGFTVARDGRVFWIPLDGPPWCAFADDGRVQRLCIGPDQRGGMPDGDVALTYLMWIQADPEGFLAEANVLRTERIEWPDWHAQLVEKLAELTRPPPEAPRRRARKPRPRTSRPLDESHVRELFARHGHPVSEELVRKLTR